MNPNAVSPPTHYINIRQGHTRVHLDLVSDVVEVPSFPAFAELLGSNPSIVIVQDSYVLSQAFFAPICSTVLSFYYRMSATVETVEMEVEMVESDIDGTVRNDSAIFARGSATIAGDRTVDSKFFCLEVSSCVNDSLLPSAAVVRTFVRFVLPSTSNILEISSMSANEAPSCPAGTVNFNFVVIDSNFAEENNLLVRVKRDGTNDSFDEDGDSYDENINATINGTSFDCNNTISSGDCGFTNDPCAVASFAVHIFGDDDDDDEGIPIARLQKKKSFESDACLIDVCIPCLADTGVSLSKARGSADKTKNRNRRYTIYETGNRSFI